MKKSLSARRAWIEIILHRAGLRRDVVALRKESVDRNTCALSTVANLRGSLSARRAWIEISVLACSVGFAFVALRKESVDRNFYVEKLIEQN